MFTVEDFMIKELKLSGADLLVYAYIYSNGDGDYSLRSIGEGTGINYHTVSKSAQRLEGMSCVKIDTSKSGGKFNTQHYTILNREHCVKIDTSILCAKIDTKEGIVSNLTHIDPCVKIDTTLKKKVLKRKGDN